MPVQQATTAPPVSPAPPPVPPQPIGVAVEGTTIPLARPLTEADASALRAKRSELSNQLNSAQGRRDRLVRELRSSPEGVARTGVEQRLAVLDARILQIEKDIAANGQELARLPLALVEAPSPPTNFPDNMSSGQITAIAIVFTVTVLGPLAVALGRAFSRRASQPKPSPQVLESTARLERMEQAIDAIAVEVERISEGQRFVTQLMATKTPEPALIEERYEVPGSAPR